MRARHAAFVVVFQSAQAEAFRAFTPNTRCLLKKKRKKERPQGKSCRIYIMETEVQMLDEKKKISFIFQPLGRFKFRLMFKVNFYGQSIYN